MTLNAPIGKLGSPVRYIFESMSMDGTLRDWLTGRDPAPPTARIARVLALDIR